MRLVYSTGASVTLHMQEDTAWADTFEQQDAVCVHNSMQAVGNLEHSAAGEYVLYGALRVHVTLSIHSGTDSGGYVTIAESLGAVRATSTLGNPLFRDTLHNTALQPRPGVLLRHTFTMVSVAWSTDAVASSKMRTCGRFSSTLARHRSCRSPALKLTPNGCTMWSSCSSASAAETCE
jgi:hypothetical protein